MDNSQTLFELSNTTLTMNYFNSLTKSTQKAIAYAVIFAMLTGLVLAMDFALWFINTTFA